MTRHRLSGIESIKTNQKASVRSKPKTAGQEYLEMYILLKQKERGEGYRETLARSAFGSEKESIELTRQLRAAHQNLPGPPDEMETMPDTGSKPVDEKRRTKQWPNPARAFKPMSIDY